MANLDNKFVRFEDRVFEVGFEGTDFTFSVLEEDGTWRPVIIGEGWDLFDVMERGVVIDAPPETASSED